MPEAMAQVPAAAMVRGKATNDLPTSDQDQRELIANVEQMDHLGGAPPKFESAHQIHSIGDDKKSFGDADEKVQSAEVEEQYFDPLNPDDVYPTEEEFTSLRRVPDRIPIASYLVAICELGERFSYYGTTVVFTNFIQHPLPPGSKTGSTGHNPPPGVLPGALGRGQRTAFSLTTFNTFWIYVTPLLGAYLADQYLGRYSTIQLANWITIVGHIMLVVCAIPGVIDKSGIIGLFIVSLIIMGIGTGMFKSNISPMIAEQVIRQRAVVMENKKGEKLLVDPALTTARLFMYFYMFINIGALVGQIGMVYAEKVSDVRPCTYTTITI